MNVNRGKAGRRGAGSTTASASYDDEKPAVSVSVTNRGDAPVLVEAKDGAGSPVARFRIPPRAGKVERRARGVKAVDFRCDQGVSCAFDYELAVL